MGFDFLVMEFLRKGNTAATWSGELGQFARESHCWGGGRVIRPREEEKGKKKRLQSWQDGSVNKVLLWEQEVLPPMWKKLSSLFPALNEGKGRS